MKYGQALEHLIRETIIADLALGPVRVFKEGVSDSLYHVGLRPTDATKMGLVFPLLGYNKELVAIPITLPMGWKNCRQ